MTGKDKRYDTSKKARKMIRGARLVSFTLVIWNIMDEVLMEAVSRYIKEKGAGCSQ